MQGEEYPALYRGADDAAVGYQRQFLHLVRLEYALLTLAAFCSMEVFSGAPFYVAYALVFVFTIVVSLFRFLRKPDQDWYKCRALAESVKTLTWRYVMRASPFQDTTDPLAPRQEFASHLAQLLALNQGVVERIDASSASDEQISSAMDRLRSKPIDDRRRYYLQHRIVEQRDWYSKKAVFNKSAAKGWVTVGIIAYVVAGVMVLCRIQLTDIKLWPIEPLIVFASSIIGWMQIRKFSELSAAYTVTAHEIGLLSTKLAGVAPEPDFSNFVNEAELAFSREHTMWIARQAH